MAQNPVGRYRCPEIGNMEEFAYVEDGGVGSFVPRSSYEIHGYTPAFETLPTEEDFKKIAPLKSTDAGQRL